MKLNLRNVENRTNRWAFNYQTRCSNGINKATDTLQPTLQVMIHLAGKDSLQVEGINYLGTLQGLAG